MSEQVRISVEGGVATVTVSNPPVNALSDSVLEELLHAGRRLSEDRDVRAVVLSGSGQRAFLAGADLAAFAHALGDPGQMDDHVQLTSSAFGAWAAMPVPVVAAIGGHAMGGGLELALLCDVLVADPRAKLGLPEVTLGLMPGAGGTQRLPRRVGAAAARRMILLGELMSAQEALAAQLVDRVCAPGGALLDATSIATRIAALPGRAVVAAKAALHAAAEEPLAQGLATERRLFLDLAASADALEGTTAFMSKRPPSFIHS